MNTPYHPATVGTSFLLSLCIPALLAAADLGLPL